MMFAVNTESGIQDIRSLLVFLWPAGHSFADRIVVPAACRRNDAPRPGPWRAESSRRQRACRLHVVLMAAVGGDRVERQL
jgi:hypothetical protein